MNLGVDIVEISRIEELITKYGKRFIERVFCNQEIEYANRKPYPAQHFAGFWSAKEAIIKALGDKAPTTFKQICISHTADNKPIPIIHQAMNSESEILLSISHTDSYAVAVAIVV